jgi:hypothetical protein
MKISNDYDTDPDPKGRNWRYWSPSTNLFLFGALLSHCNISLYWSIEVHLAMNEVRTYNIIGDGHWLHRYV